MPRPRTKPYTEIGIRRVPCARCGRPSSQQWQVCANNGAFSGICQSCDCELNRLVLEFMGDKEIDIKMARYRLHLGLSSS